MRRRQRRRSRLETLPARGPSRFLPTAPVGFPRPSCQEPGSIQLKLWYKRSLSLAIPHSHGSPLSISYPPSRKLLGGWGTPLATTSSSIQTRGREPTHYRLERGIAPSFSALHTADSGPPTIPTIRLLLAGSGGRKARRQTSNGSWGIREHLEWDVRRSQNCVEDLPLFHVVRCHSGSRGTFQPQHLPSTLLIAPS